MLERLQYILKSAPSYADVARTMKVAPATVTYWNNGKRTPLPTTQQQLCEKYGFNLHWLQTGEGPMRPDSQPTDMEKLEAIMSGKSEVKKNFIRALADMPEALLDEMLPYLRKAVAELDRR